MTGRFPVKNAAEATARTYAVLRHEAVDQELAAVLERVTEAAEEGGTSIVNFKVSSRSRIALVQRLTELGFRASAHVPTLHSTAAQLSVAWDAQPEGE